MRLYFCQVWLCLFYHMILSFEAYSYVFSYSGLAMSEKSTLNLDSLHLCAVRERESQREFSEGKHVPCSSNSVSHSSAKLRVIIDSVTFYRSCSDNSTSCNSNHSSISMCFFTSWFSIKKEQIIYSDLHSIVPHNPRLLINRDWRGNDYNISVNKN